MVEVISFHVFHRGVMDIKVRCLSFIIYSISYIYRSYLKTHNTHVKLLRGNNWLSVRSREVFIRITASLFTALQIPLCWTHKSVQTNTFDLVSCLCSSLYLRIHLPDDQRAKAWPSGWIPRRRNTAKVSGAHLPSLAPPLVTFAPLWLDVKHLPQIHCEAPFRAASWADASRCSWGRDVWRAEGELPRPHLLLCAAFKQTVFSHSGTFCMQFLW